ncbi:MAG: NAD(P)-dependent oxidoreductase [Desulfobacterales bacterium]|jgi:D-3-phosphoglycerate dehydrogenase
METILYLGAEVGAQAADEVVAGRAEVRRIPADSEQVRAHIKTCSALLDASMKVRITDRMLASAAALKIISCATTGSDHIDRQALESKGIPVRTLAEDKELLLNLTPAAELSWALLMACARNLPAAVRHVVSGGWNREEFPGIMLNGRRIGIIGCGRIGTWMSRYARAFGMDIVGYDPLIADYPPHIRPVSLEELARTSDFVTIHVPLTEETTGLFSKKHCEMVKPGAILINTSRGAIVDEQALLAALEAGQMGAAGLDVLADEPDIKNSPLYVYARTHDNLMITPHCGGFSHDAVKVVCRRAAEKIVEHLDL